MRIVYLKHEYPFLARDVWEVATDYDCLAEVMKGMITFEGLPKGRIKAVQSASVMVSLFGRLPAQPYHMEVVAFDDKAMTLTSSEIGAGVKSWRHTLQDLPTETGCTLTDRIEIEAGMLTIPFALWAKVLYAKRHKPRLCILERRQNMLDHAS